MKSTTEGELYDWAVDESYNSVSENEKSLTKIGRGVAAIKESNEQKGSTLAIPRYARINTLKWTAKEAIETLIDEDWKVVSLSTEDDFVERVGHIAADEVFIDPHIEDLLIFPHSNDFHRYWLVEQRYLILQDKASCLPAYLLSPPLDSHVFDVCAAPGMKTSHVAAILQGTGKIWAIDRSADRMETMERMLEECGVNNVSIFNEDFLRVDVNDRKFAEVRYAVVDPPCSGSGMVKRMDELTGGSAPRGAPVQSSEIYRAVYSTCSVYEEENEQVVDEVLSDTYVRQNFRLASRVLPSWKFRGLDTYEFGSDCLRADPAKTLTNGFFVAFLKG
ncbi:hypothetical protein KIN20_001799 [Parelaphostrongylus tenuis]|uniref:SAM-dependent MTase RsmB/NOP-type domain-containing protein n=1 Tax=Parelaphostrongylus tenuis TaxID=148309 RepID=A0AAD5MFV0_PARTN|nr:hypothetical protein KIN20_001799 [Parelaphostrongylus tenuis]